MLGDNEDLVKTSKTQKKSAGLWNPFRGANDIGYGSAESNFRFCWSLAIFHVIFWPHCSQPDEHLLSTKKPEIVLENDETSYYPDDGSDIDELDSSDNEGNTQRHWSNHIVGRHAEVYPYLIYWSLILNMCRHVWFDNWHQIYFICRSLHFESWLWQPAARDRECEEQQEQQEQCQVSLWWGGERTEGEADGELCQR